MLDLCDASAANLLELAGERVRLVELLHLAAASYALADEKDVRYSAPASHVLQQVLEFRPERTEVEFDHERLGDNLVLLEEDVLRFLRVGAVGLGEDDDCLKLAMRIWKG
jgi:hypothetical protein